MRLHYDVTNGGFRDGWGSNIPSPSISIKRGDALALEFVPFKSLGIGLPEKYPLLSLQAGFFAVAAFGDAALFGTDEFVESEEDVDGVADARLVYTGRPSSNTLQIAARFAEMNDVTTVSGGTYSLLATDADNLVAMTHSSSMVLTLGTAVSVGDSLVILNNSTGQSLTLAAGSGISDITRVDVPTTLTAGKQWLLTRSTATAWTVAAVDELSSITAALELQWIEAAEPISTSTIEVTIHNHYIREGESAPELAGDISSYYTKTASDARFLRLDGSQTLTTEQAAQLRQNLAIEGYEDVVDDLAAVTLLANGTADSLATLTDEWVIRLDLNETEQVLTADQKAQTLTKIGARAAATQDSIDATALRRNNTTSSHTADQLATMRGILRAVSNFDRPRRRSYWLPNASSADSSGISEVGGSTTFALATRRTQISPAGGWSWDLADDTLEGADLNTLLTINDEIQIFSTGAVPPEITQGLWYRIYSFPTSDSIRLTDPSDADTNIAFSSPPGGTSGTLTIYRRSPAGETRNSARRVSASSSGAALAFRDTEAKLALTGQRLQLRAIFAIDDASFVTAARSFVGLAPVGLPTNADPSTHVHVLGIGHDASDTTWRVLTNNGSATTESDTSVPLRRTIEYGNNPGDDTRLFPQMMALTITHDHADPYIGEGKVHVSLIALGAHHSATETVYEAVVTANLPPEYISLAPVAWRNTGASSSPVALRLHLLEVIQ